MSRRLAVALLLVLCGATTAPADELRGYLSVRWGDPPADSDASVRQIVELEEASGQRRSLAVPPALLGAAGGLPALQGQWVEVTVDRLPATPDAHAPLEVAALRALPGPPSATPGTEAPRPLAVVGSKPWLSILCRFADVADEPENAAWFEGMYANVAGGLDHYWRQVSYGAINVVGSTAVGWFTLPHDRSYYIPPPVPPATTSSANLTALFSDCTAAANAAVDFSNGGGGFEGINMMFNADLDCCAWGGTRFASLDGVTRVWRVTWEPPWGWINSAVIGHEMGHGFGLPHSNNWDLDTSPYDSPWDVMSSATGYAVADGTYGWRGKHAIAYHKDLLGWIPGEEIFEPPSPGIYSVTLDHLALAEGEELRMVRLPQYATGHEWVIEARERQGEYDADLPGDAVLIFDTFGGRSEPAWLFDSDEPPANYSSNEGSMWKSGELFVDAANDLWVSIDGPAAHGFDITIGYRNPADLAVGPTVLDLGDVEVGLEQSDEVTLTNLSTVIETAEVSMISLTGSSDFSLDTGGGGTPCGTSTPALGPGTTCTVAVRYSPTSEGDAAATLAITSNAASSPLEVDIAGHGTACDPDIVLPPTVATGTVLETACAALTLGPYTIEASGDVTLHAGMRVVVLNGISVAVGGRLTIELG
jgi:M6 family metalloprotease-like protein